MNLYSNSGTGTGTSQQSQPPPPPTPSSSQPSPAQPPLVPSITNNNNSNTGSTTTLRVPLQVDQTPRTGPPMNHPYPGFLLQSPLSPAVAGRVGNPSGPAANQFQQPPVFKSCPVPQPQSQPQQQTRPAFALPQPQQYQNYLPSPHRSLNSAAQPYSYHDSAQKAAVDNYYHRSYDRRPQVYDDPARKYPKLTAEQQWPAHHTPAQAPAPIYVHSAPQAAHVNGGGTAAVTSGVATGGGCGGGGAEPSGGYPLRKNTQETVAKSIAERFRDRPIADYATIVRQAEIAVLNMDSQNHSKTAIQTAEQNRERERQVYALLWLMKNCVSENESYVPRGRIFAQYAASCAQNSLKPLSQASLGKLIRSVFPYLTTRRLGMRGQSRYHYCGLRLVSDESPGECVSSSSQSSSGTTASDKSLMFASIPMAASPSSNYDNVSDSASTRLSGGEAHSMSKSPLPEILKLEPSPVSLGQYSNDYDMIFLEDLYKKAFDNEIPIPAEYALKFPPIPADGLPASTDPDIVSSLESLYHVHCNTIFEHVRFMKFDQLENVLMVFGSGSISPQMYNLFTSDELFDWIHECDVITHVSLIKCLSRMMMDYRDVSFETLSKLEVFFKNYVSLTKKATMDLPVPMVTKKKAIVEDFSRLVRRLVKCLKFAKQVADLLPKFKDMKQDWISYLNLDEVLDIVERDGYNELIGTIKNFMTIDVLDLLEELSKGNVYLDRFIKNYVEHITSIRGVPAFKIMDGITAFSRAFMADIGLTLQQRGLPWYYLDMLSSLLVTYCFELNRFIS